MSSKKMQPMIKKSKWSLLIVLLLFVKAATAQLSWVNVDSLYQPLPSAVHIYYTETKLDTTPFRAYFLIADLKNKNLDFSVDTTLNRRLTPTAFYERNNKPVAVVNCTFFSFATNRNLNAVIKNGKLVAYNQHNIAGKGKDTLTYRHPFVSALGISKKRNADIAWLYTDSAMKFAYARPLPIAPKKDSISHFNLLAAKNYNQSVFDSEKGGVIDFKKWKMKTAVGGGPVLVQNGQVRISNNEEMKFSGKAINDKHPRTAMGYTTDGKLIILVIEGRSKNAGGATLVQEAQILKDLGCWEALNLDGGGSSCLLVNGKQTIKVSDAGQRPVPAVFVIKSLK